ncbi:hypothetical protein [Parerythrobacter aestuarii]|uniref:hypothetical protein n=1 Tax=Parerythrobacter aestuarii TaxID=3020909 RepID=UPI0024DEE79C|nr:hypothetical protein [Parerythrobacter aestuarii]
MIVIARNALLAVIALLLSACMASLAPQYDQSLVENLTAANEDALTLFALIEDGSTKEDFARLEYRYASLIGRFDALRQRASTRYIPPMASRLKELSIVRNFCNSESDPNGCVNASPASLAELIATLKRMRTLHRQAGLDPGAVIAFRNRYDIQIDQALTVENALKR